MIEKAAGWIAPRHRAYARHDAEVFVLVADAPSPRVGRIGVVNGLRGVAILAVIYHHYFAGLTPPGWLTIYLGSLPVFVGTHLSNGWLGVNLFFVLSGFVLYLPYASGRRRIDGAGDIRAFYLHRARRLLPLYAISTLIFEMVVVRPDYGSLSCLKYYAVMITGTFSFFPGTFYPRMNLVLWTLGLENWFSVLFPFLLMAVDRFGIRRTLAATLAVSLLTRFVGIGESFRVNHYTVNFVKDSILGRLDDFVLGMAACSIFVRGISPDRSRPRAWLAAGLAMLTLGCWAWDSSMLQLIPAWWEPLHNNLINVGVFLLVLGLLFVGPGLVRSVVNSPALQIPGLMCYSLYVWHLRPYMLKFEHDGSPRDLANVAGFLVAVAVLSALSYRYIEFGSEPDVRKLFRAAE